MSGFLDIQEFVFNKFIYYFKLLT